MLFFILVELECQYYPPPREVGKNITKIRDKNVYNPITYLPSCDLLTYEIKKHNKHILKLMP